MLTFFAKDIHKLKKSKNSSVFLGGYKINNTNYKVVAHSDGDLILHAITSCLLSFLNNKTLGDVFSDQDENNKNRPSIDFIEFALNEMKHKKCHINNIDITIVCEKIMLAQHIEAICENLKTITKCKNITMKATRFENKRSKMIECYCILTI